MPFFLTVVIFVGLAIALAGAGMKLYVRPREAMERVAAGGTGNDQMPAHPSLAMHALIVKLGSDDDELAPEDRLRRASLGF